MEREGQRSQRRLAHRSCRPQRPAMVDGRTTRRERTGHYRRIIDVRRDPYTEAFPGLVLAIDLVDVRTGNESAGAAVRGDVVRGDPHGDGAAHVEAAERPAFLVLMPG